MSLRPDSMSRQAIGTGRVKKPGEFQYETGRADHLVHARHRPLNRKAPILKNWLPAAV